MKDFNLSRVPNKNGLEKISDKIFIMDNHKWAFYIWWRFRNITSNILLHIDYHWDGINNFNSNTDSLLKINNYKNIYSLIKEDKYIREDSFIAPAIITNIFREVHFLCSQNNTDIGLDKQLLDKYSAKQFVYNDPNELVKSLKNKTVTLDLDLDIFNLSDDQEYEGELWEEDKIIDFLKKCIILIKNSSIITIAYSFKYSGTRKDTNYLANLVIPIILKYAN